LVHGGSWHDGLARRILGLAGSTCKVLNSAHMFSAVQSLGGPIGILCPDSLALLLRR
jgi:hypothetical protein